MKTPTPLTDKTNKNITRQNKYLIFLGEANSIKKYSLTIVTLSSFPRY